MRVSYATAPPSVGNMAVGFDILGHALAQAGDQVRATRIEPVGVVMGSVTGAVKNLPSDPARNTAGAAVIELLKDHPVNFGVRLDLHKTIVLGSGMGGSASSAVAAVVATNQLLDTPLTEEALLPYALAGEKVASGAIHGDNVAPSLLGGIIFVPPDKPLHFSRIPVPQDLHAVLIRPHLRLDTEAGRGMLKTTLELKSVVEQTSHLASVLCACFEGNLERLKDVLKDVLVEPQRSHQIEGFSQAQRAALSAGALGCTLSGSGPSIIAWCHQKDREEVASGLQQTIEQYHRKYQLLQSPVDAPGAKLIQAEEWLGE